MKQSKRTEIAYSDITRIVGIEYFYKSKKGKIFGGFYNHKDKEKYKLGNAKK